MLNVNVHLAVSGVPDDVLDDDRFLEALWRELPEAALGAHEDVLLSVARIQWGLRDRDAAWHQTTRVERTLAAVGWPSVTIERSPAELRLSNWDTTAALRPRFVRVRGVPLNAMRARDDHGESNCQELWMVA